MNVETLENSVKLFVQKVWEGAPNPIFVYLNRVAVSCDCWPAGDRYYYVLKWKDRNETIWEGYSDKAPECFTEMFFADILYAQFPYVPVLLLRNDHKEKGETYNDDI